MLVRAYALLPEHQSATANWAVMSCLKCRQPAEVPVLLLQTNADLLEAVYCLVGLQRVTQSTSFDQVWVRQLACPCLWPLQG